MGRLASNSTAPLQGSLCIEMALLLGRHSSLYYGRGCLRSSPSLGPMQDRCWVVGPRKCYGRDPVWDCYHTGGLTSRSWKWGFLSYYTFLWVLDTQVPILPHRPLRLDTVYPVRLLTEFTVGQNELGERVVMEPLVFRVCLLWSAQSQDLCITINFKLYICAIWHE